MICFEIKIKGEPVAKGRPKFVSRGGYARAYTPVKTIEYETKVAETFRAKYPNDPPIPKDEPLEVRIMIYKPVPKSWSKKRKEAAENGLVYPTSKPDLDNYAKAILDGLNGIAYEDDAQVTKMSVEKFYTNGEPFAKVYIGSGKYDD